MLIYCAKTGWGEEKNVPVGKKITPQRTAAYSLLRKAMEDFGTPWSISFAENGRPLAAERGVFLSLSHTKTHALAAVSAFPVGADIETLRKTDAKLVRRVLTKKELEVWEKSQPERFFDYWTLKESACKLYGGTVAGWEFALDGDTARLTGRTDTCCRLLRGVDGCAAAVCFEGKNALPEIKML